LQLALVSFACVVLTEPNRTEPTLLDYSEVLSIYYKAFITINNLLQLLNQK